MPPAQAKDYRCWLRSGLSGAPSLVIALLHNSAVFGMEAQLRACGPILWCYMSATNGGLDVLHISCKMKVEKRETLTQDLSLDCVISTTLYHPTEQ